MSDALSLRVHEARRAIPELDELNAGLLDGPHLVGPIESLASQLHRAIVRIRAMATG